LLLKIYYYKELYSLNNTYRQASFLLLMSLLLFSCSGTRHLNENEYLLKSHQIKGLKKIPYATVENSFRQKPNKSVLFSGFKIYLNLYNLGKKKIFYKEDKTYDKIQALDEYYNQKLEKAKQKRDSTGYSKLLLKKDKKELKLERRLYEGNLLMRAGEPPAVYDYHYVEKTIEQLEIITTQQGYPKASIKAEIDTLKRKVKVTYRIKENEPLIYDSLFLESKDEEIQRIIATKAFKHSITQGDKYFEQNLSDERERTYRHLKDQGYYDFQRQYIYFEVDTGQEKNKAFVYKYIENPKEQKKHIRYKINEVTFTLLQQDPTEYDTSYYKGITYVNTSQKYSKKLLDSYIRIRVGEYYSLTKSEKTQQRLSELDIFKYVNINFTKLDSNLLNVNIEANPFEKYQFSVEGGVSVRVSQGNGLPGPFVDLSLKDRKIFKGFEIFEFGTRYAIQGQSSASDPGKILKSREIGVNLTIRFPKLLIPFWKNSTSILRDFSPKTKAQLGFSDIARPEYERQNFQFVFSYEWSKYRKKFSSLSPVNISFVNTSNKTSAFDRYLNNLRENGNNLFQSFQPSFISSILYSYTFNSRDLYRSTRQSDYFNFFIEPGGVAVTAYASLLSENKDSLFNVPFYQFGRIGVDYRHYKPVLEDLTLAYRTGLSLARPFGKSETLPYEKFYFSGGSNSNRAWLPRRLGPGSFSDNAADDYRFEQPGEILIETNIELRKKLFSFVHGALFVDAGNIWTFEKDDSRLGAKFEIQNLLGEIAIGSGVGLRFDLSFIILRFDVGLKIRDPARPAGDRLVPWNNKNQMVFNLGIGNPF